MWRESIADWEPNAVFQPPAMPAAIADAEQKLHIAFPDDLKSLLLESDGLRTRVHFAPGGESAKVSYSDSRIVWSVEEIVRFNLEQRNGENISDFYAPFDTLLFFAEAGNGDQMAYALAEGKPVGTDIWYWDHEDDGRWILAPSLSAFLENYLRESAQA